MVPASRLRARSCAVVDAVEDARTRVSRNTRSGTPHRPAASSLVQLAALLPRFAAHRCAGLDQHSIAKTRRHPTLRLLRRPSRSKMSSTRLPCLTTAWKWRTRAVTRVVTCATCADGKKFPSPHSAKAAGIPRARRACLAAMCRFNRRVSHTVRPAVLSFGHRFQAHRSGRHSPSITRSGSGKRSKISKRLCSKPRRGRDGRERSGSRDDFPFTWMCSIRRLLQISFPPKNMTNDKK